MKTFKCLLCVLFFSSFILACSEQNDATVSEPENADPTRRTIAQGVLTGVTEDNGSYAWLGIPYAKPPVDELRWRLPQAPEPWDGTFAATENIQPCPQFASNLTEGIADPDGDGLVGSEDCLYLSVYAPATASADNPVPVMVWIYGGGNNSGYAGDYNGANLAQSQDVVVVTINYRLGTLGWFIHPAIIPGDTTGAAASGNWSTVDTIKSLEWVRDNIAAFGGDPNNVTIFGESAGGGNVMSLVTSPMAEGLFHKAVVESGGLGTTTLAEGINFTDDEPPGHFHSSKEIVNKILIRDGKAENRDQAKELQLAMSDNEIKDLLYAQSAPEFLKLYNPQAARNYPAPKKFADGTVFSTAPAMEHLASGEYNQVPIILGTNRDERRIYMYRDPKWSKVLQEDPAEYIRVAKYPSDAWKVRGVDGLARIMQPIQGDNVYAFRFDWDEEATYEGVDLGVGIGAGHSTEMAFVFGNWDVGFVPKEMIYDPARNDSRDALSNAMMSYWANFAYTGSPAKGRNGDLPQWQPWQSGEGEPKMIVLDTPQDGGIRMSDETVTLASIKAELLADEFSEQENHCQAYASLFRGTELWDAEEYANLGQGGCEAGDSE